MSIYNIALHICAWMSARDIIILESVSVHMRAIIKPYTLIEQYSGHICCECTDAYYDMIIMPRLGRVLDLLINMCDGNRAIIDVTYSRGQLRMYNNDWIIFNCVDSECCICPYQTSSQVDDAMMYRIIMKFVKGSHSCLINECIHMCAA